MHIKLGSKKTFIEALNNQEIRDLNPNLKRFIRYIFPNTLGDEVVHATYTDLDKKELIITVRDIKKVVALKSGNVSIVHREDISSFENFLRQNLFPEAFIDAVLKYHYGDGSTDGYGEVRYGKGDLIKNFQKEISYVDEFLKKEENKFYLEKLFNHFLINKSPNIKINYYYYGNVNYGRVISTSKLILKLLSKKDNIKRKYLHFGVLSFQNLNRNLSFNKEFEDNREIMVIKLVNFPQYLFKRRRKKQIHNEEVSFYR